MKEDQGFIPELPGVALQAAPSPTGEAPWDLISALTDKVLELRCGGHEPVAVVMGLHLQAALRPLVQNPAEMKLAGVPVRWAPHGAGASIFTDKAALDAALSGAQGEARASTGTPDGK